MRWIAIAIVLLFVTACHKGTGNDQPANWSQTSVKIVGGGNPAPVVKMKISPVNSPVTIVVADIRRDIVYPSDLNKTMTVKVKADTAIVHTASPAYKILPSTFYTISSATSASGGYYTVTLNPGEFAKAIAITIPNPKLLIGASKYAMGFTIESVDAGAKISSQHSIIAEILTLNRWDGVYLNIGNPALPNHGYKDIIDPSLTWFGNQQYSLITISDTSCIVINDELSAVQGGGIYLYPGFMMRNNFSDPVFYGSYGIIIGFDSVTNKVSSIHNSYADISFMSLWTWPGNYDWMFSISCMTGPPVYAACNSRRAVLDPSGANAVQSNRDIVIKHFIVQPSVVPPPSVRSYFDETWQYLRPR